MEAVERGVEQHLCVEPQSKNLTLRKLPILHHGGFVHLAFSEPGRKRDTHSCHQRTPQGSPSLQAAQL